MIKVGDRVEITNVNSVAFGETAIITCIDFCYYEGTQSRPFKLQYDSHDNYNWYAKWEFRRIS